MTYEQALRLKKGDRIVWRLPGSPEMPGRVDQPPTRRNKTYILFDDGPGTEPGGGSLFDPHRMEDFELAHHTGEATMTTAAAPTPIACVVPAIEGFRLDLSTDVEFTRKSWGDRVKRIGGTYDKAAGRECRFVSMPNTPEGRTLAAELIERFPGHERFGGKPGTTIVFNATAQTDWRHFVDSSPRRVHTIERGKPALAQIDALLARWERQARDWWQAEGEPAARKRIAQAAALHADWLAGLPAGIAASIRAALAAGVAPEALRAAVDEALPDPRGNQWCCAQDDDGACMTGRIVHRALALDRPETRCGHVLRPGDWRATNDAEVTCAACKTAPAETAQETA